MYYKKNHHQGATLLKEVLCSLVVFTHVLRISVIQFNVQSPQPQPRRYLSKKANASLISQTCFSVNSTVKPGVFATAWSVIASLQDFWRLTAQLQQMALLFTSIQSSPSSEKGKWTKTTYYKSHTTLYTWLGKHFESAPREERVGSVWLELTFHESQPQPHRD